MRLWREAIGSSGFSPGTICLGHTSFVTTLAYVPPGVIPNLPAGALVSGSRDKRVVVWDPNTGAAHLDFGPSNGGHELDVTAVAVLPSGNVVSGAMVRKVVNDDVGREISSHSTSGGGALPFVELHFFFFFFIFPKLVSWVHGIFSTD